MISLSDEQLRHNSLSEIAPYFSNKNEEIMS